MAALFLPALAISILYAYYTIFSIFAAYDDEGFILVLLLPLGRQALERGRQYAALTPLNLPGASRLRLIDRQAHLYQELVQPLSRPEIETFLTFPGLNSLYFWAQKDSPDRARQSP